MELILEKPDVIMADDPLELRDRITRVESDVSHIKDDVGDVKRVLIKVSDAIDRLTRIEERVDSLRNENKVLKSSIQALDSDHTQEQKSRQRLSDSITDIQRQLNELIAKDDARWWVISIVAGIAGSLAGWLIPKLISLILR